MAMMTKAKREELRKEKEKLFKRLGIPSKIKSTYKVPFPSYKTESYHDTSDKIDGACPKKDIDDYKWKRGKEENYDTIQELENKKKRIAPLFNKGGIQYITPEMDAKTIGRK